MGLKKQIRNLKRTFYKLRDEHGQAKKDYKKKGLLKFAICLSNRISLADPSQQVWGDEMQARAIGRDIFRYCPQIGAWQLYDSGEAKKIDADIGFVMWPNYPLLPKSVKTKVLWLQNAGYKERLGEYLEYYDYVFTPSKTICAKDPRTVYLPMGCVDTELFTKKEPVENLKTEVCFVGNYTQDDRPLWFQEKFLLPACQFNFGLWGSGWHRSEISALSSLTRGRVHPSLIPSVYSSTDIVLANHCLVHRQEQMITTRIYEALACEAFVISDWFKELEDEFGRYLVFTEGGRDLQDKISYYLKHPEQRREKVRDVRRKILAQHTYKNRVEVIARTLGLKFSQKPN